MEDLRLHIGNGRSRPRTREQAVSRIRTGRKLLLHLTGGIDHTFSQRCLNEKGALVIDTTLLFIVINE